MPPSPPRSELGSWKQIAEYLGVNTRTAQKWEKIRGLPVRRLPGAKGRVAADPDGLDRWKATIEERPRWWNNVRLLRWYAACVTVVATALLASTLAGRIATHRPGPPALFRADYRMLAVTDASGRQLWNHTFDLPFADHAYDGNLSALRTAFSDVDGDGHTELLFSYYPATYDTAGVPLYCFSDTGQVKWTFTPGRAVNDGHRSYPGPYIVTAFAVVDFGAPIGRAIAVASRHAVYYPSQFVILDARGRPRGEYWHAGHLDNLAFLDIDGDGVQEVLLTGVNNGYAAAALAVLNPRDFTGASFQGIDAGHQIQGLPLHKELALLLFPRTCINRKLGLYNMAHEIFTTGGQIRVHVRENEVRDFVIYTINRRLECTRAEATDGFRATHLQLEAQQALHHSLTPAEARAWQDAVIRAPRQ